MFKMSLYILKTNESRLLQLNFEDILNQIQEQPKLILCSGSTELSKLESLTAEQEEYNDFKAVTTEMIKNYPLQGNESDPALTLY